MDETVLWKNELLLLLCILSFLLLNGKCCKNENNLLSVLTSNNALVSQYENSFLVDSIFANFDIVQNKVFAFEITLTSPYIIHAIQTQFITPLCERTSENPKAKNITFHNCTITFTTQFQIIHRHQSTSDIKNLFTTPPVFFSLFLPQLTFIDLGEQYKAIIPSNTSSLSFNEFHPLFITGYFSKMKEIEALTRITNDFTLNYLNIINDYYSQNQINKKDELNAILSLLQVQGCVLDLGEPNINEKYKLNYLNYLKHEMKQAINSKDGVAVEVINVTVEYSVNFNLSYSEGNMLIQQVEYKGSDLKFDKFNFYYPKKYPDIYSQELDFIFKLNFVRDFQLAMEKYYKK